MVDYFENGYLDIKEKYTGRKDLTFIIQGRMVDRDLLIRNIRNLCKYGKVVLAVWDITPELDEAKILDYIRLNRINNEQNVYLQVYTTLNGLNSVDTPFVIKIRSDEYYYNFNPFISKIDENLDKIVTTNIFFRKTATHPYHISDHIIGGLTEHIKKMFTNCKRMLESKKTFKMITRGIPEQWLTVGYLLSYYNEEELKKDPKGKMISHFNVVNVVELENFVIMYTQHIRGKKIKKKVTSGSVSELKNIGIIDVKSIEEI